ncbi:MAG: hypothetical protein AB7P14_28355 [Blastocatellales bacterium]
MAVTTLKQTEANRLNAQRSTGPKDISVTRFNAIKHGLLAEGVTELDDGENFVGLCEQLEAELDPVGLMEVFLVRRIALCMIRLRRACLIEAEFVTADLNPTITEDSPAELLINVFNQPGKIIEPGLPARLSVGAVEELVTKFQRYETSIENKLFRTINQLETVQQARRNGARSNAKTVDAPIRTKKLLASFGNQHQKSSEGNL